MNLTPREKDKLLLSMAAMVARRRLERGVKLNYPEAVALICDFVMEGARDGRSVADLMAAGATVITRNQVMDGIAEMLPEAVGKLVVTSGAGLVGIMGFFGSILVSCGNIIRHPSRMQIGRAHV